MLEIIMNIHRRLNVEIIMNIHRRLNVGNSNEHT